MFSFMTNDQPIGCPCCGMAVPPHKIHFCDYQGVAFVRSSTSPHTIDVYTDEPEYVNPRYRNKEKFEHLGPIIADEVVEFHNSLSPDMLEGLNASR